MRRLTVLLVLSAVLIGCAVIIGCGSGSSVSTPSPGSAKVPTQAALEPEQNPPGDIPDNQAFVSYVSNAGGYSLDVPEGWARTESGPNASFVDKFDSISAAVASGSAAPTVESVASNELPQLANQVEAFERVKVAAVVLPAGGAVLIRYRANSAPDAVTNKKIRLEVDRYELFKGGKLAVLSLSAPAGSDNVDVWKQISNSFKWR
jgi:hypothetical protein